MLACSAGLSIGILDKLEGYKYDFMIWDWGWRGDGLDMTSFDKIFVEEKVNTPEQILGKVPSHDFHRMHVKLSHAIGKALIFADSVG